MMATSAAIAPLDARTPKEVITTSVFTIPPSLSGTVAALRFMSFEQSSFRNYDDVAGPQADVVFEIPAGKEIVIIKYK